MAEDDVSRVLDPTKVNPMSAQPAVNMKPKWDEPELDPHQRLSLVDDPTGERNAARMHDAIEKHQSKAVDPT